jgi:outer membrane lipoprotein LolB
MQGLSAGGRALRALGLAVCIALLSACTTLPQPEPMTNPGQIASGRMLVHVAASASGPEQRFSANFELRGNSHSGELDLASPLGTVLARAHWSPAEVWLQTPGQPRTQYPDTQTLSRQVVGQDLPLQAFWDWMAARPWPHAPSNVPSDGPPGFTQLGWQIDLSQRGKGWLILKQTDREPFVTVRIKRDDASADNPAAPSAPAPSP